MKDLKPIFWKMKNMKNLKKHDKPLKSTFWKTLKNMKNLKPNILEKLGTNILENVKNMKN